MGKEANKIKLRICKECGQEKCMTAADLKEHADVCKAMNRLGLYHPDSIEVPPLIVPPQ